MMKEQLKSKREESGLSQADVAQKLGITAQYYHLVENGHRQPSPKLAKEIAKTLNVDWTIFYEEEK